MNIKKWDKFFGKFVYEKCDKCPTIVRRRESVLKLIRKTGKRLLCKECQKKDDNLNSRNRLLLLKVKAASKGKVYHEKSRKRELPEDQQRAKDGFAEYVRTGRWSHK